MRTITETIFQFDELSDKAKEKARGWYRSMDDCCYLGAVVEDFSEIAAILGLSLNKSPCKTMGGKTVYSPDVSYSVGYCQSDYAGFSGKWSYAKGMGKKIRVYAPHDTILHAIADDLTILQKRYFYKLVAHVECHHYYGQRVADTTVDGRYTDGAALDNIQSINLRFANWLYIRLRSECDYQNADEQVDETIRANEYEFYENGDRY